MAKLSRKPIQDLERNLEFGLVRARGISDRSLLPGARYMEHTATMRSIVLGAQPSTVRFVRSVHDLTRKTIRLRWTRAEQEL
jgi:fructose-1,6-bisphosphatase/sedoheptulose 1,7-bisphosphatase-like protein